MWGRFTDTLLRKCRKCHEQMREWERKRDAFDINHIHTLLVVIHEYALPLSRCIAHALDFCLSFTQPAVDLRAMYLTGASGETTHSISHATNVCCVSKRIQSGTGFAQKFKKYPFPWQGKYPFSAELRSYSIHDSYEHSIIIDAIKKIYFVQYFLYVAFFFMNL